MGQYNDHVPQILGQEWVPIRDEVITLSPAVRAFEQGQEFTLATTRTLQDMRFYINNFGVDDARGQTLLMAIYPSGLEDASGPVRKVIIPCRSGGVTGTGGGVVGPGGGALSFADGVSDPSDGKYVASYLGGTPTAVVEAYFATNDYSALLTGKRILSVNLLYSIATTQLNRAITEQGSDFFSSIETNSGVTSAVFYGIYTNGTFPIDDAGALFSPAGQNVYRMSVGEIDAFWDTSLSPYGTSERLPFTYAALQRFESTNANRRAFRFRSDSSTTAFETWFNYLALEVFYCEEQRVALGGRAFGSYSGNPNGYRPYILNTNILTARSVAQATNPALAAGDYTVVLSPADVGVLANTVTGKSVKDTQYPPINALRELYPMPAHPGIQVNIPFPMNDQALGKTFTRGQISVVPQLSLHASGGGPLTEVQVYGRQVVAPVYGTITATQEILDSVMPTPAQFPWVRFYARRFADTTVPLLLSSTSPSVSGLCTRVQITPSEWDALDEIVDGWKEVTLRFPCVPTMGTGANPQWIWSAAGELAGNRWEVLGAMAPAISGIPGNLLNLVPSPNQLSSATYGRPSSGATINMGWLYPTVTVTTDDETADATVLFSQDMAPVTGFAVVGLAQAVTGIGQQCGIDPCCIPTAIGYNHLSWSLPLNTGYGLDSFNRVVVGGLGDADIGGTWVISSAPAEFSVDGEMALITPTVVGSRRIATLTMGSDFDVTVDVTTTDTVAATSAANLGILGRYTDANNYYLARARITSDGVVDILLDERVAGVTATLVTINNLLNIASGAGGFISLRFMGQGTLLKVKVWPAGTEEPDGWLIETTDTSLTTGNQAGIYAITDTATGNTMAFDNLLITPPRFWFGNYELQRMDTVEPDWQTIMSATGPQVTSFNDYEARVGILTTYRIRAVDVYDFPGPWSSEVSITMAAPGVTGGCVGDGHVLIFTSNERQSGTSNLAYASVWEGRVEENFSFPESSFVQLQAMYNRDFFTAFRPLERGGEQFSRTVLVQAAAISPETLADFTSLRDMAWDSVPYICVRDEDGNRWFATVVVPSGRVLRDRRLYLAAVNITEVTATPSPTDPT